MKKITLLLLIVFTAIIFIIAQEPGEGTLAFDSLNCIQISHAEEVGWCEGIWIKDMIAYIANAEKGVSAYSVADPVQPTEVASYSDDVSSYFLKVFIDGDYAYLVRELAGLYIFDISDPNMLNLVCHYYKTDFRPVSIYKEGDYIYTGTLSGLTIFKIENEFNTDITRIRNYSTESIVHGISKQDNNIYLADWSGGLTAIDVSNPSNPLFLGNYDTGNSTWHVDVENDIAYVYDEERGLRIIDVSNPSQMQEIGSYTLFPTGGEIESEVLILDTFAYIANNYNGVRILSIADPSNPYEVGFYAYNDTKLANTRAFGIFVIDPLIYVASGDGMRIIEHLKDGYRFTINTIPSELCYGTTTALSVHLAKDCAKPDPFPDAEVHLEDHNGSIISETKIPDINGNVEFDVFKSDTFPIFVVAENLLTPEQVERVQVNVDYQSFAKVDFNDNLPVLVDGSVNVRVYYTPEEDPRGYLPLSDVTVILTDENYQTYENESITNSQGLSSFNISPEVTELTLRLEKEGFLAEEYKINPYLWSNTPDAFGQNNQTNIIRDKDTETTYMLYSAGDSLVIGESKDFGKTWYVEYLPEGPEYPEDAGLPVVIATGTNPTLTKLENGLLAMWNSGLGIEYTIKHSPWTPVDTINDPTIISYSEVGLSGNKDNSIKYGTTIMYRSLYDTEGDLLFYSWPSDDLPDVSDIVFAFDGSIEGIIPTASPITSGYIMETEESYLAGCIDNNNELVFKAWDTSIDRWFYHDYANNPGQTCSNPSLDFNGYNATFVWEVNVDAASKEIWENKLTPYGLVGAKRISITDGINKYPINKDDILYSYINNENILIGHRDGFSSTAFPSTYEVYTGTDSIHCFDVNTRKKRLDTEALFAFTEGSNGNYKINFKNKVYKDEVWPDAVSAPTDTTNISYNTSPISDYTEGNFPVERLSFTAPTLDDDMSYMIKLTTDDKNPHIPQIVMMDGEIMEVIYGGNETKVTEIEIPSYMTTDNTVNISIDRKKGNPNRITEIALYEYESDGDVGAVFNNRTIFNTPETTNNQIQTSLAVNYTTTAPVLSYSIPREGSMTLRIMDISGRVIETVHSGTIKAGTYTYSPKNTKNGVYFAIMEYSGEMYKTKIVSIK